MKNVCTTSNHERINEMENIFVFLHPMVELSFEFLIFFPDKSFFDEIFREKKTKEKENEKLKIDYVSQIIIYLDSIDTRLNLLKKKIE